MTPPGRSWRRSRSVIRSGWRTDRTQGGQRRVFAPCPPSINAQEWWARFALPTYASEEILHLAAAQKRQPLEQMPVLLVLEQRAVQRRDQLARVALPQHFRRHVLVEQQLEPVQQLRGRRLLLQAGHLAHLEEDSQCLFHQALLDAGEMHVDDPVHGVDIGELDVVEEAAA